MPDGLQSDPTLQRLPESILQCLDARVWTGGRLGRFGVFFFSVVFYMVSSVFFFFGGGLVVFVRFLWCSFGKFSGELWWFSRVLWWFSIMFWSLDVL